MNETDLLLEKGERSLRAAERLLADGDTDFAASRIYYAYFYTAQALLDTQGIELSRHGQVIAQYGLHFSKTRALDPTFHTWFSRAFKLRQLADYQVEVSVEPEEVDDLISGCRQFIAAASKYLEQLQGQSSDPGESVKPE
jgi:uncharacterized protein (UPF0332 family)